ncbi:MAG: hypothetical protein R8G66_04315 [Cytophagales bacterium]|nr:hypothetical protein [Cytophagales bacterium]
MEGEKDLFERNLIKTVTLIGLVRFMIALYVNEPSVDGYPDLFLDIGACLIFATGFVLVLKNVAYQWLIAFFYGPLIAMLLISFYVHNGLHSSAEVNSFALVIIFCLTSRRWWPLILTSTFLLGIFFVLYLVEADNLNGSDHSEYYTSTFSLLVISLAIVWITYHAKKTFSYSHQELRSTHSELSNRSETLQSQNELLNQQHQRLTRLKEELEEKVLDRTDALKAQQSTIQAYMQLTLNELMEPYEKTANKIRALESEQQDELDQLIIASGKQLKLEIDKIRERLISNE